jgi:hypothetical protein
MNMNYQGLYCSLYILLSLSTDMSLVISFKQIILNRFEPTPLLHNNINRLVLCQTTLTMRPHRRIYIRMY